MTKIKINMKFELIWFSSFGVGYFSITTEPNELKFGVELDFSHTMAQKEKNQVIRTIRTSRHNSDSRNVHCTIRD